jgi:hypothetical protein
MNKRKLLIGLATAGIFTAGFGAAVFPASAELRTLTITLLGGAQVKVTVDVPPGTPLDKITLPGINSPVLSISDSGAAAPTSTTTAAPAPQPGQAPTADQQEKQSTTGKAKAKTDQQKLDEAAKKVDAATPKASEGPQADAAPTAANPTFSYALPGPAPIGVPNVFIQHFMIPPFLLPIYQAAGIQYGVRWEILAAINEIETDYGRNLSTSSAGAVGWMQFMPATWKTYGVDANNDGVKDPYNPADAIFAAARYLKAAGAAQNIHTAIFSYNHAEWYVDSVLMRARLIGGLPSDLVGSLTGLTEGQFPVGATVRYADSLAKSAGTTRVKKGQSAAIPVASSSTRKSVGIYAKAGSPAVAVQDGEIIGKGVSKKLGRYIKLRDVYGNVYTYGNLKKLSAYYPVAKEKLSQKSNERSIDLPKDPKPTLAASAGKQILAATSDTLKSVAAKVKPVVKAVAPQVDKERLFANPSRPRALKAGGQEQIVNSGVAVPGFTTFKSYFTQVFGLKRSDVVFKKLKVGSRVIAGTILGRLGVTSKAAPHMVFEIRPAGKGAPQIDPKPILDGWKLLESTAIYRAAGKNPFFGPDAKTPSIGQILLMSKEALQRRVLDDHNISLYDCGRSDINAGAIDRRVLATLEFLASSGLKPTVSTLRCGHSYLTTSGNVSEHSSGNAVDISAINGIPILDHQGPGSIADITIRRLLTLQGTMKPHQIISLMTYQGADNTLALPDHANHIHVGFAPLFDANSKLGRQVEAVLKPSQWIKLISRIGSIDNPQVLTSPSKYALKVKPKLAKSHQSE